MSTNIEDSLSQDYLAAWNSHNWERVAPFFTEDCTYEDVAVGKVCHGKQELEAYFKDMSVWSNDFKIESKSFFTIGNWIASEWIMTGTHTGDVPGMKATGKKFSISGVSICETHEGKISRNTDYWNMNAFMQQIGWLPGAPANWMGRLMMRLLARK